MRIDFRHTCRRESLLTAFGFVCVTHYGAFIHTFKYSILAYISFIHQSFSSTWR